MSSIIKCLGIFEHFNIKMITIYRRSFSNKCWSLTSLYKVEFKSQHINVYMQLEKKIHRCIVAIIEITYSKRFILLYILPIIFNVLKFIWIYAINTSFPSSNTVTYISSFNKQFYIYRGRVRGGAMPLVLVLRVVNRYIQEVYVHS